MISKQYAAAWIIRNTMYRSIAAISMQRVDQWIVIFNEKMKVLDDLWWNDNLLLLAVYRNKVVETVESNSINKEVQGAINFFLSLL